MKTGELDRKPVQGKTFSLFGESEYTSGYYVAVKEVADESLKMEQDIPTLIKKIQQVSERRRYLKKISTSNSVSDFISELLEIITPKLKSYTISANEHLKHIPITKFRDRRLRTTREQYHLYMLEIELTNRFFRDRFLKSDRKIALLPYCLQDFSVQCKATPNEVDYQCRHCSPRCYQNHVSKILRKNDIEPYIWMGRSMKKLAKTTLTNGFTLGILGIACIPELTWGMRKCQQYGIPVVGLPLNANRCIRWWGEFFPNSVNLEELEKLVSINSE